MALSASPIRVGERAKRDPILAQSTLLASQILLKMAKVPEPRRLAVMTHELQKLGDGLDAVVGREYASERARGVRADQAAFDAMRVAIANRLMDRGLVELRSQIGSKLGWDTLLDTGLGDDTARQAGCIATGATTAILGTILGVYTGGAGASVASTGGQLVGGALDCGREQRLADERLAAQRAAEAQANLQRAQLEAQRASARSRDRMRLVLVGGGILGSVAVAAFILR